MSLDLSQSVTNKSEHRRNIIGARTCAFLVALAGLPLIGASSGPVAAPPAPHVTTVRSSPSGGTSLVRNPHLHAGIDAARAKHVEHRLHTAHVGAIVVSRSVWAHRWNYHSWAISHRGLGIVQGVVRDKKGRPVAGAIVELKWPKGHSIRRLALRHMTRTNANGYFVMLGVRSQRYRVSAHRAKSWGRVQLAVRTGDVSRAEIKI